MLHRDGPETTEYASVWYTSADLALEVGDETARRLMGLADHADAQGHPILPADRVVDLLALEAML